MLEKVLFFILTFLISTVRAEFDVTLNGSQYFSYSLLSRPRKGVDNDLLLLFRTTQPSALMVYMTGTTGDFVIVELVRGKLRYAANIGSVGKRDESVYQEIIVGSDLADNVWHQVEITRRRESTYVTVDVTSEKRQISDSKLATITLDKMIFVAGLSPFEWSRAGRRLLSGRNFSGCLSDIQVGRENANNKKLDVLRMTRRSGKIMKLFGKAKWECNEKDSYHPINFPQENSFMKATRSKVKGLQLQFSFRTFQHNGLLVSNYGNHLTHNNTHFAIYLSRNKLHLSINNHLLLMLQPEENIDDGMWHEVRLFIESGKTIFKIGAKKAMYNLKNRVDLDFGDTIVFGNTGGKQKGFIGCFRSIFVDSLALDLNKISAQHITLNQCIMADYCFPNPCKNYGRCLQEKNVTKCDCTTTEYSGKLCHKQEYAFKRSCFEYYQSGFRHDGRYKIKPTGLPPFVVRCNMTTSLGPMTIIEHDHLNPVTVVTRQDVSSQFYHHPMRYSVDLMRMEGLIDQSAQCRQFVRYNCYSSTLMYSNNRYLSEKNSYGARWYSRNGVLKNYWGGATPGSFKCQCGMRKKCIEKHLACNCDKQDKVWRTDEGYLTEKIDLPITRLQFSKLKTNSVSFYEVGPLECFGKVGHTTLKPVTTIEKTPHEKSKGKVSPTKHALKVTSGQPTKLVSSVPVSKPSSFVPFTNKENVKRTVATTPLLKAKPTTLRPNISSMTLNAVVSTDKDKMTVSKSETPTANGGSGQIIVINQPEKSSGAILSDQMLLLTVLTSVLILVAVAVILVLLRQRLRCCTSAQRQQMTKKFEAEMSVQEDEGSGNNNFNDLLDPPHGCSSNVTVDLEDVENIRIMIPLRYQSSSSIASSNIADTSRYLDVDGESDSISVNSGRLRDPLNTFPKRGILKCKNPLLHNSRQKCSNDDVYLLKHNNQDEAELDSVPECSNSIDEGRVFYQSTTDCDLADLGSICSLSSIRKNSPLYVHCRRSDSSSESVERPHLDVDTELNDASSSSSHSCRSFISSGSDDSMEDTEERTFRRKRKDLDRNLKRSVRFSLHEGYVEYEPCDKATILRKATMSLDLPSQDGLQAP